MLIQISLNSAEVTSLVAARDVVRLGFRLAILTAAFDSLLLFVLFSLVSVGVAIGSLDTLRIATGSQVEFAAESRSNRSGGTLRLLDNIFLSILGLLLFSERLFLLGLLTLRAVVKIVETTIIFHDGRGLGTVAERRTNAGTERDLTSVLLGGLLLRLLVLSLGLQLKVGKVLRGFRLCLSLRGRRFLLLLNFTVADVGGEIVI